MAQLSDFEPILPDPQPYVEKALALYERAVRERHGRVVFIAAELGGGKSELLGALAKALHRAGPAPEVIAGFFRGGEYHPRLLAWQRKVSLSKAALAAGGVGSQLGLIPNPYAFAASFIGQLLVTITDAHGFAEEFGGGDPSRGWNVERLKRLLRRSVEEKPLICLLDNWDEAQRFYWDSMLLSFSREVAQELPLLLFVTVKEPINLGAPEKDESGLTAVIKSLTDKGLAELWQLKKLSRAEVATAIGQAAPGIAEKLHGVTGGNARWVRELWREWRLNEVVVTDKSDRWVWGAQHKATVNLYDDILRDRLTQLLNEKTIMEVEEIRDVLACAALEGVRFTADAVALAVGWDQDDLIDLLDEALVQTEDNPGGILLEGDGVSISAPSGATRTLWQYSFVSDLHWMALERYGFAGEQRPGKEESEKLEKCAALASALIETYTPEERLVAGPIARLLRGIGRKEVAQHYQRMADCAADRVLMREQALYLLALNKDNWERWECWRTARFLIKAGWIMFNAFPHDETLPVFEEACELARRVNDKPAVAEARYVCGYILYSEGEYEAAKIRAIDSLSSFRFIRSKAGEASTLQLLAKVNHAEGQNTEARERARHALEITQEIGDRHVETTSLHLLAKIDHAEGRCAEARELVGRALKIEQDIRNRQGEAASLQLLAQLYYSEKRCAEARELTEQALEIAQEISHRRGEAVSLQLLAHIDYYEGHYAEAREWGERALKIEQDMGVRQGEAADLYVLAKIAHAEEQNTEAREQVKRALEITQEIGDRHGESAALHLLAQIDHDEGYYAEARDLGGRALEIIQEFGDRQGEAASLSLLGAVAINLGKPKEAFELMTLSTLILAQIGHADAREATDDLGALVIKQKFTKEQQQELLQSVREAYRKDGGKELISYALAKLREDKD